MAAAVVILVVAAAISVDLPGAALHNTKERTLRGTKSISGAEDLSFSETPTGMITHTMDMIIRTTANDAKTVMTLFAAETNAGTQERLAGYRQPIDSPDERIVELLQQRVRAVEGR